MSKKKSTPNQEETRTMDQQTPEPEQYTIKADDGREATVTVMGDAIDFNDGSVQERHVFDGLLNRARRGGLPGWAKQIPALVLRIEDVFQRERAQGLNPHVSYSNSDGTLTRHDLLSGQSVGAPIIELKKRLAQTGKLPRAFDTPRARELIERVA